VSKIFKYYLPAATLSLLILTAQLSVSITKHYCGGKLKSLSLTKNQNSCCGSTSPASKTVKNNQDSDNDPCCQNIESIFSADIDLSFVSSYVNDYSLGLVTLLDIEQFIPRFYFSDASFNTLKYIPPLLGKDICILVQRFLL